MERKPRTHCHGSWDMCAACPLFPTADFQGTALSDRGISRSPHHLGSHICASPEAFLTDCQYPSFQVPGEFTQKNSQDNKVHCRWFLCFRGNRDLQVTPGPFSSQRSLEGLDNRHRSLSACLWDLSTQQDLLYQRLLPDMFVMFIP